MRPGFLRPSFAAACCGVCIASANAGEAQAGPGYTALLTMRTDIGHYTPTPGILPIAPLEYRGLPLDTTDVPGGKGFANTLFFRGKLRF